VDAHSIEKLLESVKVGETDVAGALERLAHAGILNTTTGCSGSHPLSVETTDATVDLDRRRRCGFPEVVFCQGKTVEAVVEIITTLHKSGQECFGTRLSPEQAVSVLDRFPDAIHNEVARTIRLRSNDDTPDVGLAAVITAGTSDRPVAEEAIETLRWMRCGVQLIQDVGVAGPHRLYGKRDEFTNADAIVVAAGMEGALPSMVGGFVDCPVVAVPTSVGYGASFSGVAALLGMLNSCASNVTVVNIDAGFKAGYVAGMIARRIGMLRQNTE
jgi:pyridinium-3,5-biscarboxylic acid mononucleotide synthase